MCKFKIKLKELSFLSLNNNNNNKTKILLGYLIYMQNWEKKVYLI